ncbi:MAG: ferrochelatase [Verrucomicrobiota bacterium]
MVKKTGVLLLNLGSPDSTEVGDVRRYLREFLMDGRVLDAPKPIRWMVVNAFILPFRPKNSAEAYSRVWTDQGSPLIVTSRNVRDLLDREDCPVFLAMNYGSPSIPDEVAKIRAAGVTDLFIMPQYPHYAMSSYETVVVKAMSCLKKELPGVHTTLLQPFYQDDDYLDAVETVMRPYLTKQPDLVLFSFHGIPERHLRKSDPSHAHCLESEDCCENCHPAHATCYRHQCFTTAHKVAAKAGLRSDQYRISFQSRLGRDPWLTPYTDKTLESLPEEGIRRLLVICPAFVTDCLETLEEISMEGKEIFEEAGGEWFEQIPCLNDHPAWIEVLMNRINRWRNGVLSSEQSPKQAAPSTIT